MRAYLGPGLGVTDFLGFEVDCSPTSEGCPAGYTRSVKGNNNSACIPSGNLWHVRQRTYCEAPTPTTTPPPPAPPTSVLEPSVGSGSATPPTGWTPETLDAYRRQHLAIWGVDPFSNYSPAPEPEPGFKWGLEDLFKGGPSWLPVALAAGAGIIIYSVVKR